MSAPAALLAGALALAAAGSAAAQCLAGSSPNYDFVTAPQVLFETDFTRDPVGDFPQRLEYKTGAMEVGEWEGLRALKASSSSVLAIPLSDNLPERFTLELGVVNRNTRQIGAYTIKVYGGRERLSDGAVEATRLEISHSDWRIIGGGASADGTLAPGGSDDCIGQEMQVRLTVDGSALKVYADGRRVASIPNATFLRARGLVVALEGRDDGDNAVYLTHIRLAGAGAAAPVARAVIPMQAGQAVAANRATATSAAPSPRVTGTATARPGMARERLAREPLAPGPAPLELVVRGIHPTGVTVIWRKVPGASHYTIVRVTDGGDEVMQDGIADTAFALAALAPGATAAYAVLSNFGLSHGPGTPGPGRSSTFEVTTPGLIHPSGFRAVAAPGQVELAWDPVPYAAGYSLHRTDGAATVRLYDQVPASRDSLLLSPYFYDTDAPTDRTSAYWVAAFYRDAAGALYSADNPAPPRVLGTAKLPEAPEHANLTTAARITSIGLWGGMVAVNFEGTFPGDTVMLWAEQKQPTGIGELYPTWQSLSGHASGLSLYGRPVGGTALGATVHTSCRNPISVTRLVRLKVDFLKGGFHDPARRALVTEPRSVSYPNCSVEYGQPAPPER